MAAAFGISTTGGALYTQVMPCSGCAKAIIQSKVTEVVLHRPADEYFRKCFTGSSWAKEHEYSEIMFGESGMKIRWVDEIVDCIGYFGGKMVSL
jgi:deoxycytidylate deaminase